MSVAPASGQSLKASTGTVTSIGGSASLTGPASEKGGPESSSPEGPVEPSTLFSGSPSPGTKSPVRLPQAARPTAASKAKGQARMGPHDDSGRLDRQVRSRPLESASLDRPQGPQV